MPKKTVRAPAGSYSSQRNIQSTDYFEETYVLFNQLKISVENQRLLYIILYEQSPGKGAPLTGIRG